MLSAIVARLAQHTSKMALTMNALSWCSAPILGQSFIPKDLCAVVCGSDLRHDLLATPAALLDEHKAAPYGHHLSCDTHWESDPPMQCNCGHHELANAVRALQSTENTDD